MGLSGESEKILHSAKKKLSLTECGIRKRFSKLNAECRMQKVFLIREVITPTTWKSKETRYDTIIDLKTLYLK